MAFDKGGLSEKLGNRYEARWAIKQLLALLFEHIRSVKIETIGDEEIGVDLIVLDKEGKKEFQQCKAQNYDRSSWNLSDLKSRGIIKKMVFQLRRDKNLTFSLISSTPSPVLTDITDAAKNSNGSAKDFIEIQIGRGSRNRKKNVEKFFEILGLNISDDRDRLMAFDYLRRIDFHLFSDDKQTKQDLEMQANFLATGDAKTTVSVLRAYAEENIRKEINTDQLWRHLKKQNIFPKRLAGDERILPAITSLREEFNGSITPFYLEDQLVQTEDAKKIKSLLMDHSGPDLIIVSGAAGLGKSCILMEISQILFADGISFLPIRLDRRIPAKNTKSFGNDLGLPDSPASCLAALNPGNISVLILDQLDALRWSSTHKPEALDVVKNLVRESTYFRRSGADIRIIVASRTFELKHDPNIKAWIDSEKGLSRVEIPISGFSPKFIRAVLQRNGISESKLTGKQLKLLEIPQNLYLFLRVTKNAAYDIGRFRSSTDLMREYWKVKLREIEKNGLDPEKAKNVLYKLVDYMERTTSLWAPTRLLLENQKIGDALQSLNIVTSDNSRIVFSHQSLFDFLSANRIFEKMDRENLSLTKLLGSKDTQTLFRREQVRLVLRLFLDENVNRFVFTVQELINSSSIRFHIKSLVLSCLNDSFDCIPEKLRLWLIELLSIPEWKLHILGKVFVLNPAAVKYMVNEGIIRNWLNSDESEEVNLALWLLRSVGDREGDIVSSELSPFILQGGDWPQKILSTICFLPHSDSDIMFNLRLSIMDLGINPDHIGWRPLIKKYPDRVFELLARLIQNKNKAGTQPQRHGWNVYDSWEPDEFESLRALAGERSELFWKLLPILISCSNFHEIDIDDVWLDGDRLGQKGNRPSFERGIVLIIIAAGKSISSAKPEIIWDSVKLVPRNAGKIIDEIIAEVFAALPNTFSDGIVDWLLSSNKRFSLGSGYIEPEWMPAVRLIAAHSPYCSNSKFTSLQSAILKFKPDNFLSNAISEISYRKKGYYRPFWGEPQHFLLPALCAHRRSSIANSIIGVLARTFEAYGKRYFLKSAGGGGGSVGSPIKNSFDVSDASWLKIVSNRNIPIENNIKWKQVTSDTIAESSVRTFSGSLYAASSINPCRFGLLAIKFPIEAHSAYISAVLHSLQLKNPPNVKEISKESWEPATAEIIEKFLEKYVSEDSREVASQFCSLLEERSEINWSNAVIERLLAYSSTHPDPGPIEMKLWVSQKGPTIKNASSHDLLTNAINCIRGKAGMAIAALLWDHPDLVERFVGSIKHLSKDPNPSVRIAAVRACCPLLSHNKDLAVNLFLDACLPDLRVAASQFSTHFLNYTIKTHFSILGGLIRKMLESEDSEVVSRGASEVACRWLFYDLFKDELDICLKGNTSMRAGIAEAASNFIGNEDYTNKCILILSKLIDDNEPEVLRKVSAFALEKNILQVPGIKSFAYSYVKSKAFIQEPSTLLNALDDCIDNLSDYSTLLIDICRQFCNMLAEKSRDISTHIHYDSTLISPLLLRLYESALLKNEKEIANLCLDCWDMLLKNRVGEAGELEKSLDSV